MKKIEEIVDNLNIKLWGKRTNQNLSHCFCYTKKGFVESISLFLSFNFHSVTIDLWSDNAEDRNFNEKINEYEDLEVFLIKKYRKIVKEMNNLTKDLCK